MGGAAGVTPQAPEFALLVKLGSIVRHAEEAASDEGHPFDTLAVKTLLDDPDVVDWLAAMDRLGLLPVKR
jgi:hypothetical protein